MCGNKRGKCRCNGVSGQQVKKAVSPQIQASANGASPKVGAQPVVKCSAQPAEKPKVTYSVSGVVTGADGAPLSGATVNFLGKTAVPPTTGQNGAYQFTNLDAGTTGDVTVSFGQRSFVPARQTIAPLQSNRANVDFQQAAFNVDCALTATGNAQPGPHFLKLLERAEFVLSGDKDEVKAAGATGSCSFGPLPSGSSYQVALRLDGEALGAPKPINPLTKAEQLSFEVDVCKVYGSIDKLLDAEVDGTSVELRVGATTTKLDLKGKPTYEFPCVPKGFKCVLVAKKQGFTIPEKQIDKLTTDTERKFVVTVFTVTGRISSSGNALGSVDVQVAGPRTLKGAVLTNDKGEYSVDLPKSASAHKLTPILADCDFEPAFKDNVTAAGNVDFKQATYNVEVEIDGADTYAKSHLAEAAGMVGTGSTRRTELSVKLSGRKNTQKPKVGPNTCTFQTVLKGAALTVSLHQPPAWLSAPPAPVGPDGKAKLVVAVQSFTLSGTVQRWDGATNVTAAYGGLTMDLLLGTQPAQSVQANALTGAYAFNPVRGGAEYEIVPRLPSPMTTCEPTGAATIAYRTHKFKDLAANHANCDFMAMSAALRNVASPPADLYVNPGVKVVLSYEMVRNLRGERGAEHKVRLDLLREAILYALNHNPDETEGVKGTYFVALNDGRQLTLVLANKRNATPGDHFVGNVFTAYHT